MSDIGLRIRDIMETYLFFSSTLKFYLDQNGAVKK